MRAIENIAEDLPVIFPVHPRTRMNLQALGLKRIAWHVAGQTAPDDGLYCMDPLGYMDFMSLAAGARLVLTDSGGLQEETTALGIPCLTLRENTERPVTVSHGTNRIVGQSPEKIIDGARRALAVWTEAPGRPPLWDGQASRRIVDILLEGFHRWVVPVISGRVGSPQNPALTS